MLGTVAYGLGLIVSAITDPSSGAMIVWALLRVAVVFNGVIRAYGNKGALCTNRLINGELVSIKRDAFSETPLL